MPKLRGMSQAFQGALLAAVGLALAACGGGPTPHYSAQGPHHLVPHPTYKVGAPYTIKGVTYYPKVDYSYDEVGTASWYGEAFDGQYTANGEVYDLNLVTAAHRTLPLPSIVEVVNLQNNRAMRVRVNDRGPFVDGRILDVSRRVAQLLGFERSGTARVRVRVIKEESLQAAAMAEHGVIGGATTVTASAARPIVVAAASMPAQPQRAQVVATPVVATASHVPLRAPPGEFIGPRHRFFVEARTSRMQMGPIATAAEADRLRDQMIHRGYRDARIVID